MIFSPLFIRIWSIKEAKKIISNLVLLPTDRIGGRVCLTRCPGVPLTSSGVLWNYTDSSEQAVWLVSSTAGPDGPFLQVCFPAAKNMRGDSQPSLQKTHRLLLCSSNIRAADLHIHQPSLTSVFSNLLAFRKQNDGPWKKKRINE